MKRLLSILLLVFAFSYVGFAADVTLDMFEYSTSDSAQAAYVSSDADAGYTADLIPTMTSNTAPSGVASAYGTPIYAAWLAMNDTNTNEVDCWHSAADLNSVGYTWLQYQFTSAKIIARYTITGRNYNDGGVASPCPTIWKLQGSNNGSDWTDLDSQTGQSFTQSQKKTYSFQNSTTYSYYRLYITGSSNSIHASIGEVEMIELLTPNLQCYSEDTIKQQGTYSLKGIAVQTDSLNDTLTRTVDPTIDLSGKDDWIFYIYSADRTGSQIKLGIHDSGGTTTESTPDITDTGVWQKVTVDISGVANVDKDAIDSVIITIANADAANTFYFDNMYGTAVEVEHPTTSQLLLGGMWFKNGAKQHSDWTRFKRGTE